MNKRLLLTSRVPLVELGLLAVAAGLIALGRVLSR